MDETHKNKMVYGSAVGNYYLEKVLTQMKCNKKIFISIFLSFHVSITYFEIFMHYFLFLFHYGNIPKQWAGILSIFYWHEKQVRVSSLLS